MINPTKSDIGHICKVKIDRINKSKLMQWTNTDQVLSWFVGFKEQKYSFFNGFNDMVNYYSSISEELVIKTLNFADRYISVPAKDLNLIKNACKSVLCEQGANSVEQKGSK